MKGEKKPLAPTKRWKRGQSCVSNPEYRKFRDAAKKKQSSGFQFSSGSSGLTCDALMKHNAEIEGKLMELSNDDDDAFSVGRSIATSRASSCTNATFKKVIHNFSVSNVAAHKEVLSVLETVAEMIKAKSDDDSDLKYLMTLLHLIKSEKVTETGHVSAILYLLSLCIKRVPQPVLRMKFGEASKIVLEALRANVESESLSLVKSAITILAALLRSLDHSSWKLENTKHIFFSILCLADCDKHKVRKVAQHAVGAVLRGSCFMLRDGAPANHPAVHDTFEFCRKKLEERPKGADKSYLYIIALLGDILSVFSKSHLEKLCEVIVGLVSPADVVASNDCLNSLRKMFAMRPKEGSLTPQFNAWIISELFKNQPTVQLETMDIWLLTMGKAYSNLAKLDPTTFLNKLPDFFKACFTIMSNQPMCAKPASEALMACISECTCSVISCASEMSRTDDSPVHRLVKEMTNTYSMLFMRIMETILAITDRLVEFFGKSCSDVVKQVLKPLYGLKCTEGFPHKNSVTKVFATSVRIMGPRVFLEVLPLQITGENDDLEFSMSWILPLMRDNIQDTDLEFFIDYFLPLLSNINKNMSKFETDALKKTYEIISDQMWSLLPGFCTRPNDLAESFPKLAKLMANLIRGESSENSRMDVLASLRKVINSSMRTDDEKAVVGRFAKNYLPLLCSAYTGTRNVDDVERTLLPESLGRAVLETFKVYLKVAPESVVQSCIFECMTRHASKELSVLQRNLVGDLIVALVPYMSANNLTEVCRMSKEYIENNNKSEQKKGYRLLEEICSARSEAGLGFASEHLEELSDYLAKSFESSDVISKAPRLRCIAHLVRIADTEKLDFLRVVIPEAVMCISIPGSRKKTAALNLLVEVSKGYTRWNTEISAEDAFKKFMVLLIAGLASSPISVIKCTITAIAEVLRANKSVVGKEVLEIVVENLMALLKSKTREVVKSALDLMKVLVTCYVDFLSLYVKPMVTSLVQMSDTEKHHFRFKTREIYVRLVKKFGHKLLLEMMPENSHKIINHIRKELERAKKKKKADKSDSESEGASKKARSIEDDIENLLIGSDDDDDEDDMKSSVSRKSMRNKKALNKMVFVENEEATDFLDPSAHKSVLVKKDKKDKEEIKMRDGKLIIGGGDDDDNDKKMKKKRKGEISDDDDDDFDDCVSRFTGQSSGKKNNQGKVKRKRNRDGSDDESDDDDDARSKFTYRSGGTGIHRKNPSKQPNVKKQRADAPGGKKSKNGDATKGGVQPYSYVPLDKKMLNKRFRSKFKL